MHRRRGVVSIEKSQQDDINVGRKERRMLFIVGGDVWGSRDGKKHAEVGGGGELFWGVLSRKRQGISAAFRRFEELKGCNDEKIGETEKRFRCLGCKNVFVCGALAGGGGKSAVSHVKVDRGSRRKKKNHDRSSLPVGLKKGTAVQLKFERGPDERGGIPKKKHQTEEKFCAMGASHSRFQTKKDPRCIVYGGTGREST